MSICINPSSSHQRDHQVALADGLKTHGITAVFSHGNPDTKHVACWGWRMGKMLRDRGHEVLVMERGYLGDRFNWSSLAWNGLNNYGDFGEIPDDGGGRFRKYYTLDPWREPGGDYVLLMGQVPNDASLRGRNLMPWYESVGVIAADAYKLPVRFRPHPNLAQKGIKQNPRHCEKSFDDLDTAIANARVVITYNSNSAVDAVVRGVPAVTMDEGAMAWPVSGHVIGLELRPNREKWAREMAWKQWRLEEIADGSALNIVLKGRMI